MQEFPQETPPSDDTGSTSPAEPFRAAPNTSGAEDHTGITVSGTHATEHTPATPQPAEADNDMPPQPDDPEEHRARRLARTLNLLEFGQRTRVEEDLHVPVTTGFFRGHHANVAMLGDTLAPMLMEGRRPGAIFHVLDVGCSEGSDTWSLASVLAMRKIPYHLDAIDVNRKMLELTGLPYRTTLQALRKNIREWGVSEEAVDFFETVGDSYIRPTQALRDNVGFLHMDIRYGTPALGIYDAVVANNVFMHYGAHAPMVDSMLRNIAASLRVGGILTFSDRSANKDIIPDSLLAEHRLLPSGIRSGLDSGNEDSENKDPLFYVKVPPEAHREPLWRRLL